MDTLTPSACHMQVAGFVCLGYLRAAGRRADGTMERWNDGTSSCSMCLPLRHNAIDHPLTQ